MSEGWPEGVVVREDEPLARHTALRTGGPCDGFVVVHRPEALADTFARAREIGWQTTLIGAGTRTVVRDGGLAGAVIRLGTGLSRIERDGTRWRVGAGATVGALVGATAAAGQCGLEGLAGTPGSLGAALVLDAGPGEGWGSVLESVRYLWRGRIREGSLAEACDAKHPVITGATFLLDLGDPEPLRAAVKQRLAASRATSWWEPPARADLRKVLRKAAIPGVRLRGVAVSEATPETIVNLGGGTAHDLSLLQRSVKDRVSRERGITLEPRIHWSGTR